MFFDGFNGTGSGKGSGACDETFRPKAVKGGPSNPKANGFFLRSGDEIVPLAIAPSFLGFGVEKFWGWEGSLCTSGGLVWLFMKLRLGASSEYEERCSGETGWCYNVNGSWTGIMFVLSDLDSLPCNRIPSERWNELDIDWKALWVLRMVGHTRPHGNSPKTARWERTLQIPSAQDKI